MDNNGDAIVGGVDGGVLNIVVVGGCSFAEEMVVDGCWGRED